jgi:hypothetical protein
MCLCFPKLLVHSVLVIIFLLDFANLFTYKKSEMKRSLVSYGVSFAVFEVNTVANANAIQKVLKSMSGISTVPNYLFIY